MEFINPGIVDGNTQLFYKVIMLHASGIDRLYDNLLIIFAPILKDKLYVSRNCLV